MRAATARAADSTWVASVAVLSGGLAAWLWQPWAGRAVPAHDLDGCDCEPELRRIVELQDLLNWWRLVALVFGLLLGFFLLVVACLLPAAGRCLRCLCQRREAAAVAGPPIARQEPASRAPRAAVESLDLVVTPKTHRQ